MDVTVGKLYLNFKNRHLNIILYVYRQNNMHGGKNFKSIWKSPEGEIA